MGKDENVISSSNVDTKSADDSVLPPVISPFSPSLIRSRSVGSVSHPPKSVPKSEYDEELDRELAEENVKPPKQVQAQGQNEEEEWHPTEKERKQFFEEMFSSRSSAAYEAYEDSDTAIKTETEEQKQKRMREELADLLNLEDTSTFRTAADVVAHPFLQETATRSGKTEKRKGSSRLTPVSDAKVENEEAAEQEKKRTEIKV